MNLIHYFKLLWRNIIWIVVVPIATAITVYLLTQNEKKEYLSTTTLYTGVASGYSIASTEDQRIDYFAVNNAFDNLLASAKSRETIEAVSLRLLAEHLALKKPDSHILGQEGFENLQLLASKELLQKTAALKTSEKVYKYILEVYKSKANNIIEKIVNNKGTFYNINELKSNLIVTRINASDIIQVVYTCHDPAVCMRTLQLHSEIFNANYKQIKSNQTFSVVRYFEAKLEEVKNKLRRSEDELKKFGKENQIINYYEQTRYIAEAKEGLNKDIYDLKVNQSASKEALQLIEKKLNDRERQITNSLDIIKLRQNIGLLSAQIEKVKVYGNSNKAVDLLSKVKKTEDSLRNETNQYINLNYTLETVPRGNLIQEWVNNAISYDKATAGLVVLKKQEQNYLDEINEFAPLGSTLKRLDRQIDINEKEFLAILHALNLARLRQSNISLNSNIVVQDKPFLPLEAQPSTRKMLIIVSFLVSFLLVVSIIIAKELLDTSIKTPENAIKIIGLPLAGVSLYQTNPQETGYKKTLVKILTEQLINTIMPYISASALEKKRLQIGFITTQNQVFNVADIVTLNKGLKALYPNLIWVIPHAYQNTFNSDTGTDFLVYTPTIEQLNFKTTDELANTKLDTYDLILYITPNLSENGLPLDIIKASNINLLAVNALTTWRKIDKEIILRISKFNATIPTYTWLINTKESDLETHIGEIPKKRGWIRKKLKKLLTLNLR